MSNVPRRLQKFPEGAFKRIRQLRFRRDKKSGMIAVVMDFGGQKVMHPSYAHSVACAPFAQLYDNEDRPLFQYCNNDDINRSKQVFHAMHSVLLHRLGTFLLLFSIPKLLNKRSRPEVG